MVDLIVNVVFGADCGGKEAREDEQETWCSQFHGWRSCGCTTVAAQVDDMGKLHVGHTVSIAGIKGFR